MSAPRSIKAGLSLLALSVLLSYTAAQPAGAQSVHSQVIGGRIADMDELPAVVAIQGRITDGSWATFCTGTLVAPQWVLTAAHCLNDGAPGYLRVRFLNMTGRPAILSDRHLYHPSYLTFINFPLQGDVLGNNLSRPYINFDYHTSPRDVGLVHLASAAPTPPMPMAKTRNEDQQGREDAEVAGYGVYEQNEFLTDDNLRRGAMSLETDSGCNRQSYPKAGVKLADSLFNLCRTITPSLSGDAGIACFGDSGGPVMLTGGPGGPLLVGAVSWGLPDGSCYNQYAVDIYTRLSPLAPWISRQTGLNFTNNPYLDLSKHPNPSVSVVGWRLSRANQLRIRLRISSVDSRPRLKVLLQRFEHVRWRPSDGMTRFSYPWRPVNRSLLQTRDYRVSNSPRGSLLTLRFPGGKWRLGHCLVLAVQAYNKDEMFSRTLHLRLGVRKHGRGLVAGRSRCGYNFA